jgi:4-diphosphocytidyl-2-C-methyl-D-erythritol kinase
MDTKIQSMWYFCNKYVEMLVFPKAKINLGLRITAKRVDGYHNIESIFYPVSLCDALEMVVSIKGSDRDTLTLTGYSLPGSVEENIILRAVSKLRESFSIPFLKIHLHKNIPAGAGLGGGSSDAACMLKTINRIFGLSLSTWDLKSIASGLGSDCPFFIDCKPAFVSGRGEILVPVKSVLSGFYGVLLNPGISISTKDAYDNCLPAMPETSLTELITRPVTEWKKLIFNDFERTIFYRYPQIKMIKQVLYDSGAVFSSMSGSGSTVYGIFNKQPVIPGKLKEFVIYNGEL